MKRTAIRVFWDEVEKDDGIRQQTVRRSMIVGYVPRGLSMGTLVGNLRAVLLKARDVDVYAEAVNVNGDEP